jgi:hypothetical protein
MDARVLVNEEKYEGQYVALKSFTDSTVLAFGDDPLKVMDVAKEAGVTEPVVVYIPKHDVTYIY